MWMTQPTFSREQSLGKGLCVGFSLGSMISRKRSEGQGGRVVSGECDNHYTVETWKQNSEESRPKQDCIIMWPLMWDTGGSIPQDCLRRSIDYVLGLSMGLHGRGCIYPLSPLAVSSSASLWNANLHMYTAGTFMKVKQQKGYRWEVGAWVQRQIRSGYICRRAHLHRAGYCHRL